MYGAVNAPPSKSVAQRAIAIASLAAGLSVINRAGDCEDVRSVVQVCRMLGADIVTDGDKLYIRGGVSPPVNELQCGESGLGLRVFSCITATFNKEVTLTGVGSLCNRPMHFVEASLKSLGVVCKTNNGRLPITVNGPITIKNAKIDASESSQMLSGILIAAPLADGGVHLAVKNLVSKPYVDLTIETIRSFGVDVDNRGYQSFYVRPDQSYKPFDFVVEGDWSGAAFMLVAGAIAGEVFVNNLNMGSQQPDQKIMDALGFAGSIIKQRSNGVHVCRNDLKAFHFDASDCPDLFPPLVVLASNCMGESTIHGLNRLYGKESNRALTLKKMMRAMGISITTKGNTMYIRGGKRKEASVNSHGDHRIAMAASVAALTAEGPVQVDGAEAVYKSYPNFYYDLQHITK